MYVAEEVSVQSAPSDDLALQVFTIHEGTKTRIDQQSGEWAEIVLADGKVGWVRVEVLEII
jgi:SH3-like domain-containing protein